MTRLAWTFLRSGGWSRVALLAGTTAVATALMLVALTMLLLPSVPVEALYLPRRRARPALGDGVRHGAAGAAAAADAQPGGPSGHRHQGTAARSIAACRGDTGGGTPDRRHRGGVAGNRRRHGGAVGVRSAADTLRRPTCYPRRGHARCRPHGDASFRRRLLLSFGLGPVADTDVSDPGVVADGGRGGVGRRSRCGDWLPGLPAPGRLTSRRQSPSTTARTSPVGTAPARRRSGRHGCRQVRPKLRRL